MKTYNALDLAKYIVKKCIDDGYPISNLQLQKILYCIQREALREGNPAFLDEIQAWKFGPVVPKVYYRFCGYGTMEIRTTLADCDIDREDMPFVNRIAEGKRVLEPWDLVQEVHIPGGAYDTIFQNGRGFRHEIPRELIRRVG